MTEHRDSEATQAHLRRSAGWLRRSTIGICMFLLIVALVGGILAYRQLQARIQTTNVALEALSLGVEKVKNDVRTAMVELLLKKRIVDLSEPIFQNADERFDVGKLEVAKHLAGVRISGILLNTSSVGHKQLTMSVSVAGRTKEFTVNSIRPGYAAKFSVYVPDVKAEDARFAEFEFVRSTVSYHLE